MWQTAINCIISCTIGIIFSFLKFGGKKVADKTKKEIDEAEAVKKAVQILLGAELTRKMQTFIKAKEISTEEYKELEEQLKVYEALDGDGTVHKLWEAVGKLYIY